MRTAASFILLYAVLALFPANAADVQLDHMQTLSTERNAAGSADYREAVDRYLRNLKDKIVGGKPALAGAFPWQVSLTVSWIANPSKAHFCGGTVYSPTWIITAAHCVVGNAPKDIVIVAGTHILGVGGTRHNVERIISKLDYNKPVPQDNDIALLQLREPLVLGNAVKAIPLVTATDEPFLLHKGTPLIVTGWGATAENGSPVRDLRYVEVPFVERETCNRPLAYDGQITNNMICAGLDVGGKDSCQGDSGGPLTVDTRFDPKLAGVVSWGNGCAQANHVGVYTRVANYAKWIESCVASPETCK